MAGGRTLSASPASRRPRILISGYVGAGNLGDEALLAGLLAALRARDVDAIVASVAPARTRAEHHVATVDRFGGTLGALARVDAVVSGGGGLLQDASSFRSLAYYLAVVVAARMVRRPVAVFAQSLGPLSPRGARAVRRALRGVKLGLRDAPSLRLATELGLEAQAVADTALLLDPAPAPVPGSPAPLVLVPRAGYPLVTDALVGLAGPWAEAGGPLRVAAVDPARDATELERLLRAFPNAEHRAADRPQGLVAAFTGAHAVVSGRLHGMVLGAVAGAPVAGLAYDPKVTGFGVRIGAPVAPMPLDGAGVAAAVAELAPFVAAPYLNTSAVARERALAAAGVDWLLREALHVRSSVHP